MVLFLWQPIVDQKYIFFILASLWAFGYSVYSSTLAREYFAIFNSPEPKAHGELILKRMVVEPASVHVSVRPSVRNRSASESQFLYEISIGRGNQSVNKTIQVT